MTKQTGLTIRNDMGISDIGQVLAKSGFFQDSRDAAQAIVKVLAGAELGIGPVASMTGIYIVKGRVTLSANLIAGAIKRSDKYNFIVREHDDTHCVIDFYEFSKIVGTSPFSMADAKRAGLAGDNWTKYPRNMLYARALSNGAKWYTPDVFSGGVYTPDELGQEVDGESGEALPTKQSFPVPAEPVTEGEYKETVTETPPASPTPQTAPVVTASPASGQADDFPPLRTGKQNVKILVKNWSEVAKKIAEDFPMYQDEQGKPEAYHILGVLYQEGLDSITPENVGTLADLMRRHISRPE